MGRDASIIIASACRRPVRMRRTVTRLTGRAEVVRRGLACSARRFPDSRRNVKDMLICGCQSTGEGVLFAEVIFYPLTCIRNEMRHFITIRTKYFLILIRFSSISCLQQVVKCLTARHIRFGLIPESTTSILDAVRIFSRYGVLDKAQSGL